jgi:hypothetical protein
MWQEIERDPNFESLYEAYRALCELAQATIRRGDGRGEDVRLKQIRLRDGSGTVWFQGTLEHAANLRVETDGYAFQVAV